MQTLFQRIVEHILPEIRKTFSLKKKIIKITNGRKWAMKFRGSLRSIHNNTNYSLSKIFTSHWNITFDTNASRTIIYSRQQIWSKVFNVVLKMRSRQFTHVILLRSIVQFRQRMLLHSSYSRGLGKLIEGC